MRSCWPRGATARPAATLAVCVAIAVLASCTSGSPEPAPSTPAPSTPAPSTPESTARASPARSGGSSIASAGRSSIPPRAGVRVTCRSAGLDAQRDKAVLLARAARLTDATPKASGDATKIIVVIPGATRTAAASLCARGVLELRPLIAATVTPSGAGTAHPFAAMAYPLPSNDTEYAQLAPGERRDLQRRVRRAGCAADATADDVAVRCGTAGGGAKLAGLLARPIVFGTQVRSAVPVPPSPSGGTEWSVRVTLDSDGGQALTAYTSAHSAGDRSPSAGQSSCGPTTVPCSDYLGLVLDGNLIVLPLIEAKIFGTVQIVGGLTKDSATGLASTLSSGVLEVPLVRTSIAVTRG